MSSIRDFIQYLSSHKPTHISLSSEEQTSYDITSTHSCHLMFSDIRVNESLHCVYLSGVDSSMMLRYVTDIQRDGSESKDGTKIVVECGWPCIQQEKHRYILTLLPS